ncbi:hypothetical protein [Lysinibacter cavernae]|uniref:Uncharacterized protein n=1 Tax=Lysinibacter cavernae TaxID=1640652 RepID=A0A7X5R124_9MICO|nr:hypothetical protein [Lysinibacter cavernae]NIH53659.1 hypothetical protein [Lysinibacter cavernae]
MIEMNDGDLLPAIVGVIATFAIWVAFGIKAVGVQRELAAAHLFIDYLQLPIPKESTLGSQARAAAEALGEPKFRETPIWLWALISVNSVAAVYSIIRFALTTDSDLMTQRLVAVLVTFSLNAVFCIVVIRVAEHRRGMLWKRVITKHAPDLANQINWGSGGWGRVAFEVVAEPAIEKVTANRRNRQRKANRRAQRERAKRGKPSGTDERGAAHEQ